MISTLHKATNSLTFSGCSRSYNTVVTYSLHTIQFHKFRVFDPMVLTTGHAQSRGGVLDSVSIVFGRPGWSRRSME